MIHVRRPCFPTISRLGSMAELAYAEVSKTSVPKTCGFDPRCSHQLSPHVLIQSMRTSFCIYRLMDRQNKGYNYQIWAIYAGDGLLGLILLDEVFHSPALFRARISTFLGRNQRFIMKCTLLWTITRYRPQYKVSSRV